MSHHSKGHSIELIISKRLSLTSSTTNITYMYISHILRIMNNSTSNYHNDTKLRVSGLDRRVVIA